MANNNVPTHEEMQTEPALTIGEIFASKVMIQPVVAALIAIASQIFHFTVENGIVDNLTLIVTFAATIWTVTSAQAIKSRQSREQAKDTREAVYAPATVEKLVEEAYEAGIPPVDPKPEVPDPPASWR